MNASKGSDSGRDLLIVDDDPVQVHLFRCMLRELGFEHRCHYAASGPEALDFLSQKGRYGDVPRPELIILDLNMPGMDGCEVLSTIKKDPALCSIPVVMFSVGTDERAVNRCYTERANAYVRKPGDYPSGLRVVEQIEHFWLQTVQLPA